MRGAGFPVERRRGSAAELHGQSAAVMQAPDQVRAARLLDVTAPAVVMGRAQPSSHLDHARVDEAGIEVIRRGSGGGAVWVGPAAQIWLDVVVPAGDPLWDADVGRAAWWLGQAWVSAMASAGVAGGVVHRGGLLRRRWSDRVCFAGLGPGEVTVGNRKVVGVAQRRTRSSALFQTMALVSWDPGPLVGLLDLADDERQAAVEQLSQVALGVGGERVEALQAGLVEQLARR